MTSSLQNHAANSCEMKVRKVSDLTRITESTPRTRGIFTTIKMMESKYPINFNHNITFSNIKNMRDEDERN